MDHQVEQLVQATIIASDARQANLHQEALQFISTVQADRLNAWKLGLAVFTTANTDGTRKYPPQARFFGLRLLESFLDDRFDPLDDDSFQLLKKELLDYVRSEYILGSAEINAKCEFMVFQA